MAKGFNLTAQINLQGPSNVNVIVSNIKKQLGTISANVNLKIDPASAKTVTSLNSSLNQLNSTLKTTSSSATNAAAAVRDLMSAMKGVASIKIPTQISSSLTSVASSSASAQKALSASRTEIEEFGNQAGLAVRRFAAFSTVTSVIYGLTGAISNGISEFIDFDQQLTRISQVTGESKDELGRLKGTITSLSTGLGVTAKDLANVSVTLSQAGLSARETENALEALALSALTPSFDNMNETVEGSIALMRQFKIGSNELEQALGSINAVSAKFAVESSDIISAIQRTGGVFAAASKGVSEGKDALNEFIAVFTSVRATTRESAETIATGLRTIFTRLQRGDTIEALKEYGVNLTDLDGKFVGAYKAVQLLSEGLGQIDPRDLKFSKIVEELGGFRQIGKVIPLIQEFTTAQQALQVAQGGQGSLASDAAKGQLALAVQISKTKQEFLSLIRSIGDTDSFQKMVTVGLSLANALIKVADAAKGIIPLIGLFAAFKAASAIRQFGSGFGSGFGGGAAKQNNRPLGFASGGLVPGQGNSDSVSARLTPGEFVMSKPAVRSIGTGTLHALNRNSGGIIPRRYYSGGVASVQKLSPGQSGNRIRDYIDYYDNETRDTNKKQTENRKKRSNTESPKMLKGFQLKDNVNSGIKRKFINESKIKKTLGDNEEFKSYINSIASKDQNRQFYTAQGAAFEEFLFEKILNQENYTKAPTKNYPLDFIPTKSGLPPVEAKFTYEQVPDAFILNKRLRYNLLRNQDETIAPLSRRNRPDNIELGPTIVYEMQAGLKNKIFSPKADEDKQKERKQRQEKKLLKLDKLGLRRNTGGPIQRFGIGGGAEPVRRTIGIIDSDSWKGDPVVAAAMKELGITKPDEYKVYISNLAAQKRQANGVRKLRTSVGVAASGKTFTAFGGVRGQEADNATLRKTTRTLIRVPSDFDKLGPNDEIIDTTSVITPRNFAALRAADRIRVLSTRSKESQDKVLANRDDRDILGASGKIDPTGTNFGQHNREAGSSTSAPANSGPMEALLAATEVSGVDRKKVVTTDLATGKRISPPTVRTPDRVLVQNGNMGPLTKAHEKNIMEAAKKAGIPYSDAVVLVAGNARINPLEPNDQETRTAIFPQTSSTGPSRVGMAQAVLGPKGFNVAAASKNDAPGAIPSAMLVGPDSYIVPHPERANVAVVGSDKEKESLERYRKQGYEPLVLPRDNKISATAARAAIMSNDMKGMRENLSEEAIRYLQPHMAILQKRQPLLDAILKRMQENAQKRRGVAGRYTSTLDELSTLPARVTKTTPESTKLRIEELRKKRDKDEKRLGRLTSGMLGRFERLTSRADGGFIQKFLDGGWVQRMQRKPDSILRDEMSLLSSSIMMMDSGERKGTASTFNTGTAYEDIGKREAKERFAAIQKFLQERTSKTVAKLKGKKGAGLQPTEQYDAQEQLDAITYYQGGSGPLIKAMAAGKKTFSDRESKYQTSDVVGRLNAATQFKAPKKLYSGLGPSQLREIIKDTGVSVEELWGRRNAAFAAMTGKNVDFPTFVSTTDKKQQALRFVGNPGAMLNIDSAKAETKVIDLLKAKGKTDTSSSKAQSSRRLGGLDKIDPKKLDAYDAEREFILPPGVKFKINSVSGFVGEDFKETIKSGKKKKFPDSYEDYLNDQFFEKTKLDIQAQMFNSGGTVQRFEDGGIAEELRSMGRADLIDLAKKRGVSYDQSILDPRKKLSPVQQAQKEGFLRSLTEAGILRQAQAENISRRAQSRSIAVVGVTGERGSQEVTTPGATDKITGASVRGVPVTLQTGGLPPALARRVQALIRNRVERIVADVGMQLSQAAGMGKNKRSRSDIRRITSKDLEDITGSIFEKGIGAANLQYDEKSKAIDLPQGLNSQLAKLVGVDPGVMTDVTNTASKETAKRKVKEGQFDRGRLEARSKYGRSQFATGGMVQKFAGGGSPSDFYSLEAGSGLKSFEFDNAVKFAKMAQYSLSEFKTHLDKLRKDKQNRQSIKTDKDSLAKSLMPSQSTATAKQLSLAESLKGPADAGYRPILTAPQRVVADRANIRKSALEDLKGTLAQGYAVGGIAEKKTENKPEKQFGKISIDEDAGMVSVGYLKNNTRSGYATAYKMRDNLYYVGLSSATKGYGPRLYDTLMEAVTEKGAMLTSDRNMVSGAAQNVWQYYFKNRSDVKKTPLKPSDWTQNSALIDPKLYGKAETWPPATDPAWVLQSGYSKSANLINSPDVIRSSAKPDSRAMALSYFSSRTKGLADGGTVPALVSNGEAYIPPETAKEIGYSTLRRMNQADRNGMNKFSRGGISVFRGPGSGTSDSIGPIGLPVGSFILREKATKALGFSSGGPAGSVQEFAIGGAVQRLFFGGPTLPAKPDNPTEGNVQISSSVGDQLRGMVTALNDLGISSSKTAEIIKKGGQISYQAAIKAYSADIQRMRLNGASAVQVADAERKLRDIRADAAKNIETRKKLSGVGADQLQNIDTSAQFEKERLTNQKRNSLRKRGITGEAADKVLEGSAANIEKIAYQSAAKSQGVDLKGMGLSGQDMQKYIQRSMMDAKTLQKMNAQYLQSRQKDLEAVGHSAAEARKIAQKEIKEREAILSDVAKSRGMADPTGKGSSEKLTQRMMMAGFMLPMIGSAASSLINPESSAANAATSAGIQGATNTVGMGLGTMSMLPMDKLGKFGGMLGVAAVAAAAVGQAMIDARNATIEFEKKMGQNKAEKALEEVAKTFLKLEKDINNVDLKKAITDKLLEAGTNLRVAADADMRQAKAYWVNLLDAYFGGGGTTEGNRAAAERSQILDKKGIFAYFNSTGFGQAMQGNLGKVGNDRADIERAANMRSLAPERAQQEAKMFADTASQINQLIEKRFRSGESVKDVMGKDAAGGPGPSEEFKQFAEVLSRSNALIGEQILNVQASILLSDTEKKAKIESIQMAYAEAEARKTYGIVSRQKEMKALEQSTSLFSRSLERMYQNMEQSINRTIFTLDKMSKELDLVAASFKGEATVGQGSLDSINVLQNPRAYSVQDRESARDQASSFFSGNRDLVKGLLSVGDNLEKVIMGTISSTMRAGGGSASNEKIGQDIAYNIKDKLAELSLPADVGDKLAKEVEKALGDLRKEDNEQIDFSQLAEKIPQLSKVVESAKRAQEVALKALENWQNALNNYSARTNQLVDLQVDTNNRLRKSTQILADSQIDLAKSLGQEIRVSDTRRVAEFKTGQLTGGLTSPKDIADNILNLEGNRRAQETGSNIARNRGASGVDDFMNMQKGLKDTNTALRENYEALKNLADNSDVASAALGKIQEAQQKNQGRVSFIEKLVTSTPDEMDSLGRALGRLQTNMNGQVNIIQRSQGAQQAYYEALQNGASGFEAMKAAQAAFANERKETLGALNDIMPFLGNNKQSNNIKANVLESMLQESGQGVSPIMQQVLTTLRNPQADPETQAAMAQYQQAINLQSEANRQLAMLNTNLASQIADASAKALKDALTGTALTFNNSELSSIREDVSAIKNQLGNPGTPVTKATGGVIYAAAGMGIDFSPKGTDTVPAMLTPGEFVVNRAATQRNLPLLQSINSQKHSSGGPVRYYAGGGYVSNVVKPEYNADTKGDSLQVTNKSYMDPDTASFKDLLEDRVNKVYKGWTNYTRSQKGAGPSSDKDNIYSKNRGYTDGTGYIPFRVGALIPGAAPNIEERPDGYFQYTLDQPVSVDPAKETKFAGDLFARGALGKRPIKKGEIDSYKRQILDIKKNIMIPWGRLPADYDIGTYESINAKAGIAGNKYNPNLTTGKSIGLFINTDKPNFTSMNVSEDRDRFQKVWEEWVLTAQGMGDQWAGTIVSPHAEGTYARMVRDDSVPETEPDARVRDPAALVRLDQLPRTRTLDESQFVGAQGSWVKQAEEINKLIGFQTENQNIYNEAMSAVNTDDFKFVKTEANNRLYLLQQQLQRIYEDRSLVENITQGKEFLNFTPINSSDDIIDLHVLSGSKNDELRQKMKELKAIPNVREDKGWNKLNVGTRGPLLGEKWMDGSPINIENDTGAKKEFPWIANLDPTILLANLAADVRKKQEDLASGKEYGFNISQVSPQTVNEKLPAPLDQYSLKHTEQYLKYTGPLWNPDDPNADPAGFLTDNPLQDYFVVKPSESPDDMFQYAGKAFKNQRNFAKQNKPFDLSDLISKLQPAQTQTIADYIKNPTDPQLMTDLKNISVGVSPSLITAKTEGRPIGLEGFDLFSQEDNNSVNLNMGSYLTHAIEELAQEQQRKALGVTGEVDDAKGISIGIADADKQKASVNLTRGALNVFGRSKIPGFANGWLARYIGRMPSILGMAKNNNIVKSGTAYIANVFNEAGAYASKLFQMARNPQQYNALKEAYVMISGATSAFNGLSNGDTRFLKLLQDQGDYSSLFRSLGALSGFQKAANNELTADYQAQLGQELKGSKIRKVGADGSLGYADFNNSVPKTYQDLVDIALNPYNEFTSPSIRKGLIDTLITDISNGKDSLGMPFFDKRTLDYINNNLRTLQSWYGGDGNAWPGQDSFYDEALDAKTRTDNVINALNNNAAGGLLDQANLANTQLGVATKFGNLPSAQWFEARKIAQPQFRATGGMIYASKGQMVNFQPRGTDTVPAMLTPGEFVINRQATQKNLPLLQSINNGNHYSKGGSVNYLAKGGEARPVNAVTGYGIEEKPEDKDSPLTKYKISSILYPYASYPFDERGYSQDLPPELKMLNNLGSYGGGVGYTNTFFGNDLARSLQSIRINRNNRFASDSAVNDSAAEFIKQFKFRDIDNNDKLTGFDFSNFLSDSDNILGLIDPDLGDGFSPKNLIAWKKAADRVKARSSAKAVIANLTPDLENIKAVIQDQNPVDGSNNTTDRNSYGAQGQAAIAMKMIIYKTIEAWKDSMQYNKEDASKVDAQVVAEDIYKANKTPETERLVKWLDGQEGAVTLNEKARELFPGRMPREGEGSDLLPKDFETYDLNKESMNKQLGDLFTNFPQFIAKIYNSKLVQGKKSIFSLLSQGARVKGIEALIKARTLFSGSEKSVLGDKPVYSDPLRTPENTIGRDDQVYRNDPMGSVFGADQDQSGLIDAEKSRILEKLREHDSSDGVATSPSRAMRNPNFPNSDINWDKDGDRRVSREEFRAKFGNEFFPESMFDVVNGKMKWGDVSFNKYDTNKDEYLNLKEFTEYFNQTRGTLGPKNDAEAVDLGRSLNERKNNNKPKEKPVDLLTAMLEDKKLLAALKNNSIFSIKNTFMPKDLYGIKRRDIDEPQVLKELEKQYSEFSPSGTTAPNVLNADLPLPDYIDDKFKNLFNSRNETSDLDSLNSYTIQYMNRVYGDIAYKTNKNTAYKLLQEKNFDFDKSPWTEIIAPYKNPKYLLPNGSRSVIDAVKNNAAHWLNFTTFPNNNLDKFNGSNFFNESFVGFIPYKPNAEQQDDGGQWSIPPGQQAGNSVPPGQQGGTVPPPGQPPTGTTSPPPGSTVPPNPQVNKNLVGPFARDKYYDELTYKEYLMSLIKSEKAPEAPDKKLFTTPALYTIGPDGQKVRLTAYDTRETQRRIGGGKPIDKEDINHAEVEKLANQIFFDYNNAQIGLSAFKNPRGDANSKDMALEGIEGDYGNLVNKVTKLSTLTNLSRMNNKPIMVGEDKKIPFSIDDVVGRLRVMREIYNNEILAKKKEKLDKVDDSILDDFLSATAKITETNNVPTPADGKPFTGKEVRTNRGIPGPVRMPVRGMAGVETQYKNSYSHYRRILGEYNYHQNIGRGKQYAQGNKTTSRVAKTLSSGGMVYASTGMLIPYAPKGTDTVPAMLTPGEFVVNRAATQANLPLLQSINKNKGGEISYYATGGVANTANSSFNIRQQQADTFANQTTAMNSSKTLAAIMQTQKTTQDTQGATQKFIPGVNNSFSVLSGSSRQILTGVQEVRKDTTKISSDINQVKDLTKNNLSTTSDMGKNYKPYIEEYGSTGKQIITDLLSGISEERPRQISRGGMIYASKGQLINFEPKGTDTVPAMLTPGEFVINARATQQNLPLLQAINKNKGGVVYAQKGILVPGPTKLEQYGDVRQDMFDPSKAKAPSSDIRKAKRREDLQRQIKIEEEKEFRKLGLNYNDSTTIEDILRALKEQRYSEERKKYYLNQFKTDADKSLELRLKRFPRISEALDKARERSTINPFDPPITDPLNPTEPSSIDKPKGKPYSRGGVVYANNGMLIPYQPRGTDTVPAMLTPGEFVVNRQATQQNLSLLKAINSGNYNEFSKGYSQGGVVYLRKGGLTPDELRMNKEKADEARAQKRQEQKDRQAPINARKEIEGDDRNQTRGLENSPVGQIILRVKAQAESYPNLFEALNDQAINQDLTKADLITKYDEAWKTMDPSARYSSAQQQFKTDKARVDYLQEIYNNSISGLDAIKKSPLLTRANYISVGNSNIVDILEGQKGAKQEGEAIHNAWIEIFKKHPEFRSGPVSAGSTQAAGMGSVAGQTTVAAAGKQYGGMIYANHGMMIPYTPRGSDTVPAMLTPGEFVVNRASTQQNLPLLQAINNNRYSRGGSVKYLQYGGMADESGAGGGVSNNSGSSAPNMDGLSQFTTKFGEFIGQLQKINLPPVINVMGNHKVEVIFNGAEILRELEPTISRMVVSKVGNAMQTISDQTEGGIKYQV
jgi:TP901 family phage tail tape measure protein